MSSSDFKSRSIETLLDTGEYQTTLDELLTIITKRARNSENESTLASVFESELYHYIQSFFGVRIKFIKEEGESIVGHKFQGRMDAVSNDLVIEYKHFSNLKTDSDKKKATDQVKKYLSQLNEENKYRAILTDGIKIKYFYYQNSSLKTTSFSNIDVEDLNMIVRSLLMVEHKRFVPENIVKDFRINGGNSITKELAKDLFKLLMEDNIADKTSMLFNEWEVLFHLSEADQGRSEDIEQRREALSNIFEVDINNNKLEYKALFALQTTYAIIVKLIACKVISKLTYNTEIQYFSDLTNIKSDQLKVFLQKLEDGYSFVAGGIRNLLEGDFFSWYPSDNQWNKKEAKTIIKVIKRINGYSKFNFKNEYEPIDIFRDLYMEIMPSEVRHSLGEYFTPAWLADYVVKNSISTIDKEEWTAIDPCCGSGIFAVSLIKNILANKDISNMSSDEKEDLLFDILNRVKGIDINPLSVLTSRVSYLLALSPIIDDNEFEIPIYLGDSADIPAYIEIDGVDCYQYTIKTQKEDIDVILPLSFVKDEDFIENMNKIQSIIRAEKGNIVFEHFKENINEEEKTENVLASLEKLSKQLVDLHKKNWDSIWMRIVTNFMLIARIEEVDIIVGNPPWVKWEHLPQNYAEKIKSFCLDKHLFSGQTYMGAISLNICALISNVVASSWLTQDGVLAFLMPKNLMTQDSYAGFRNFYVDYENNERMYLQKVDDWSKAGHPFIQTKEKFLTYYYMYDEKDYSKGIPITSISKKRGISMTEINQNRNFNEVKDFFKIKTNDGAAYQLDEDRTGFTILKGVDSTDVDKFRKIIGVCKYKARSGVEFTPTEIYNFKYFEDSNNEDTYLFKNYTSNHSRYKAITNDGKGIELETDFIRPLVKGPNVEPFNIKETQDCCFFPYKEENGEPILVSFDKLVKDYPKLTDYLTGYKETVEKQSERSKMFSKGNKFYALSKVGEYTFADSAVVFRDNTALNSSVVQPVETPWGNKEMPICAKHAPYISMDKNKRFITSDEAYYICGILNTEVVNKYFDATFSNRSYSINFNIKIPLYNKQNDYQKEICDLSKKAHKINKSDKITNIKNKIEKLYLKLCDEIE